MARGRASNGSGMQPRKRKDGLWEVRATIGTDPGTGKLRRKSIYGRTAAEAAEKLRAAVAAVDEGTFIDPSKITFSAWADIWLKEYTCNVRPSTRDNYDVCIRLRAIPAFGAIRLCELTPVMYQKFINGLSSGPNPLAPNTVHITHGCIHLCLSVAVRCKYIQSNPSEYAILPKVEDRGVRYFETEEIAAFMAAAKEDPAFYPLAFFALYSGARQAECLGLRWSRINFTTGEVTIDTQLLRTKVLGPTKSGKKRTFKLPPSVIAVLKAVKIEQAKNRLVAGSAWIDNDFVFTDEVGKPRNPTFLWKHFSIAMKKAGLTGRTFHSLRHTNATESLRAGTDPRTVSERLGHSKTWFTMDIYGHATQGLKDDAALKLEERIKIHEILSK